VSDLELLVPCNSEHSIKESIFTLFLSNPIVNPKRFISLIQEDGALKNHFQHFKSLGALNVNTTFKDEVEAGFPDVNINTLKDTGFVFESFVNGTIAWALKYDGNSGMNAISIHCYQYSRWDYFLQYANDVFIEIIKFNSDLFVTGVGLSYIDKFDWLSGQAPKMDLLFKDNGYMPKLVLESVGNWNINTANERLGVFLDNLEQNVIEIVSVLWNKSTDKHFTLTITHNAALTFSPSLQISESVLKTVIKDKMNNAHTLNKSFLNQCLQPDILAKIKLPS
jgi:uncharacterized protein (TIGR04255 family)